MNMWCQLKQKVKSEFRGYFTLSKYVFLCCGLMMLAWCAYLLFAFSAWHGVDISFMLIKEKTDSSKSSLNSQHERNNEIAKSLHARGDTRVTVKEKEPTASAESGNMVIVAEERLSKSGYEEERIQFWDTALKEDDASFKDFSSSKDNETSVADNDNNKQIIVEEPWKKIAAWEKSTPVFYTTYMDFLLPSLREKGFRVVNGQGSRRQEAGTDYERWIMSTPALNNFVTAPDEMYSKVQLVTAQPTYRVGDQIQVRVDLYNGAGQRRTSGGDEIRMRLLSYTGNLSVAAEVTDLQNGSYLATSILQWPGLTFVRAYLTYPREFLRKVVHLRLILHATFWNAMNYSVGNGIEEVTACLPSQPIPGYAAVCNLTDDNGGLPYYCGFPWDARLNCSHGHFIRDLHGFFKIPMSPVYKKLITKIDTIPHLRLIPNAINVNTLRGLTINRPLPCWSRPTRDTWLWTAPRGWWSGKIWRPLTCSYKRLRAARVRACLRNSTIYLLGDSNMRLWWDILKKFVPCTRLELGHKHIHKLCEVDFLNITLKSAIHGQPAHTKPVGDNVPITVALQELRHHRRHLNRDVVLVLHYYLHFSYYGLDVFTDRVKAARKAIEQFLKDVPDAKVLIRGPHVVFDGYNKHVERGDNYGPLYIQAWKKEFQGLWDRVRFLNFWDMSIAAENKSSHPENYFVKEMVKVLLGHICGNVV